LKAGFSKSFRPLLKLDWQSLFPQKVLLLPSEEHLPEDYQDRRVPILSSPISLMWAEIPFHVGPGSSPVEWRDLLTSQRNCSHIQRNPQYLPNLVIAGSKCVEICEEIKLPDPLPDSPGVVFEMLIPLAEML
jgi:hypothetical protein